MFAPVISIYLVKFHLCTFICNSYVHKSTYMGYTFFILCQALNFFLKLFHANLLLFYFAFYAYESRQYEIFSTQNAKLISHVTILLYLFFL